MSGDALHALPSRRNRVYRIESPEGSVVRKVFASSAAAENEAAVCRRLEGTGLKTARLLSQEENVLCLEFLCGEDYVRLLERQESVGYDDAPWDALLDWLLLFNRLTGLVQRDMNLRNFLWLEDETAGLDFEDCGPGDPAEMLAGLSAYVLNYDPGHTALKRRVAAQIRVRAVEAGLCTGSAFDALSAREESLLLQRRQRRRL